MANRVRTYSSHIELTASLRRCLAISFPPTFLAAGFCFRVFAVHLSVCPFVSRDDVQCKQPTLSQLLTDLKLDQQAPPMAPGASRQSKESAHLDKFIADFIDNVGEAALLAVKLERMHPDHITCQASVRALGNKAARLGFVVFLVHTSRYSLWLWLRLSQF